MLLYESVTLCQAVLKIDILKNGCKCPAFILNSVAELRRDRKNDIDSFLSRIRGSKQKSSKEHTGLGSERIRSGILRKRQG